MTKVLIVKDENVAAMVNYEDLEIYFDYVGSSNRRRMILKTKTGIQITYSISGFKDNPNKLSDMVVKLTALDCMIRERLDDSLTFIITLKDEDFNLKRIC